MAEPAPSVVVIGASAGGVEALKVVAAGLPGDLHAAIAVVLHVPPDVESRLAGILDRAGELRAAQAEDGDALLPGRIYVAPPDRHLFLRAGSCAVVRGPRENGVRPSVDVLFRSAAVSYGPRAVAVVLSGARDDGAAGSSAVGRRGGTVIVQDPEEAAFPGMPASTLRLDDPSAVLPLREVAPAIVAAVARLTEGGPVRENGDEMSIETEYAALDAETIGADGPPGVPSPFACPACGGVLWEVDDDEMLRFRCRVGHAFTAEGVVDAESAEVERALWTAVRALHERAHLAEKIAGRLRGTRAQLSGRRFEEIAGEARREAEVIRKLIVEGDGP
jgi:two-component system chemotaxis response regulator CheB